MNARQINLVIKDEINVRFEGLSIDEINFIIRKTGLFVKGYFSSTAYKHKIWDGRESQFFKDGSTFLWMLDTLMPVLAQLGIHEEDLNIIDLRPPNNQLTAIKSIDANLFATDGITLRYYQVETINAVIEKRKGVVEVATAGGKTFIASAIAKVYDSIFRTMVIVPNDNLGVAMKEAFERVGLSCEFINKDIQKDKRVEALKNCRHIIITYQTLYRNAEFLKDFDAFVYDEVHIMGDKMFDLMRTDMGHMQIRIGMTGTFPEDKNKRQKILCRIGGDILSYVETKTLVEEGYISKPTIKLVEIKHPKEEVTEWLKKKTLQDLPWTFDIEERFLNTNRERIKILANFIMQGFKENTLILCDKELGNRLAVETGLPFIDGETNPDARIEFYKLFEGRKDVKLIATWGTVGTGISIDDIFCGVLIDAGKDPTRILQGIGRTLRLDTEKRNTVTIYDVYSDLMYSLRHKGKRVGIYNKRAFVYDKKPITINTRGTPDASDR